MIASDDVEFATPHPHATIKNFVPEALQLLAREIFAQFSEGYAIS